jgi:hypothetical protein
MYVKYSVLSNNGILCFRLARSEVEEECWLRREMEEDLAELREDHDQTNGERVATYEAEIAEWKTYEKARVSLHPHLHLVCVGHDWLIMQNML